ncbi:putative sulfate exporter family transporter [Rhodobacteraceae bacterium nBUS_22]|jgi:uncharacterized membrane protein YadS
MTLDSIKSLTPVLLIVSVIVLAAQFVSDHYGAPAMLLALLFGIALQFVSEQDRPKAGIAFASRTILRFGVALLGLRISADLALSLGLDVLIMIVGVVVAIVKLVRVAMLAPVIIIATFVLRQASQNKAESVERQPLVPVFVIGFFGLLLVNSMGWIPAAISDLAGNISRWALLAAIAAVGLKTSLKDVLNVGGAAIGLLVAETIFIAMLVLIFLF